MVFVQDIITGDKMGHYNHLSSIEREIILCGIPKRHLRHKGKPRRRKGNEEKMGTDNQQYCRQAKRIQ